MRILTFEVKGVALSHTFALIGANETGKSNFLEAIALVGDANAKLSHKDYFAKNKEVRITLNYELGIFDKDYSEVLRKVTSVSGFEGYGTSRRPLCIDVSAIFDPIKRGENESPKRFLVEASIHGFEQLDEPRKMELNEALTAHFKQKHFRATVWKPEKEYIISESIDLDEFANTTTKFIPLRNCFKMAKLQPKDMLGLTEAEESDIERKLEDVVTNYIKRAWPSHPVRIKFRISDRKLTFLVEDEEFSSGSKTMEQRSDGFRWFVSFLLTIASDHSSNSRNIQDRPLLLLDEPDLHLHPQAQADLLRELIGITQGLNRESVLFFATHSNHMIDKEHIERCYKFFKILGDTEIERADSGLLNSYAEVNYSVFEVAGNDYHNELYGYLESTDEGKAKLDGLPKNKKWYNTKFEKDESVSWSKYIRNSIHHPENKQNKGYEDDDLRRSIETMQELVKELQADNSGKAVCSRFQIHQ